MDKDKCPTCDQPEVAGRRVRGEWNKICSNGHNWLPQDPKPAKYIPENGWRLIPGFYPKPKK